MDFLFVSESRDSTLATTDGTKRFKSDYSEKKVEEVVY
jgi:hypothetical protein